ncbi:flagellar basal body P-ring formation chaperone FlgA [Sulfurimonas sp.]|uniref:flagellar basal body P-ring formation chaperone FlgA n=1 Tax=Sulfurimonas sp. TaxID=2022749 RepID=UPI00261A1F74|nr:flagellar basal body P-ring formation chaperone FlgA [Sulfurimonas sp.]
MLSDIVAIDKKNDIKLYKIDEQRHSKRIKATQLIEKLKHLGYPNIQIRHTRFVQFNKKSHINTLKIHKSLQNYYKSKYKNILIRKVEIAPIHYLENMPKEYTVHFNKRAFLSNKGVLYIKTQKHKKIFFKYELNAVMPVYQARMGIKKDTPLSVVNTKKNSIMLDKFRAMPLQEIKSNLFQARHNIQADKVITKRDITGLNLVTRGSTVNVFLDSGNISISFSAKAVQNGKLGDTISVVQSNGKKMKAVVIGKNSAEVR